MRRLTDEERDRAATCVPMTRRIAGQAGMPDVALTERLNDAANDALVYSATRWRADGGRKFSTFAYALMTRMVYSLRRRIEEAESRTESLGERDPVARQSTNPLDRLIAQEEVERVEALANLGPREKRVWRRWAAGEPLKAIAADEGVSHQAIGVVKDRAMGRLREKALRGGL